MDPSTEIIVDTPFVRIYKDRRVVRLVGTSTVPPDWTPQPASRQTTSSSTVTPASTSGSTFRTRPPGPTIARSSPCSSTSTAADSSPSQRLPRRTSASSTLWRRGRACSSSPCNYRLAPEHPLPVGYEDSFRALKWVVSGGGGDPWLSQHRDLGRVFLAGDSSRGNIVHNVAMMAAALELEVAGSDVAGRVEGAVLLHTPFGGREPVGGETPEVVPLMEDLWRVVCPEAPDGLDDSWMNPFAAAAPSLRDLPCKRVLVCAAEVDFLRPRCRAYYEGLAASGWGGTVEWFESEGQEHVFFLREPRGGAAVALMGRLVAFFTES